MDSSLEQIHELGLLDDQTPQSESFWPQTSSKVPFPLEYEGPVTVRTSKMFFNSLSAQWLGFKSPVLYFAEICHASHVYYGSKYISYLERTAGKGLKNTPCNLIYYTKSKSKMPCRVVLRHHGKVMTFYFKEENAQEAWVKTLRSLCLMDDFSSQYSRGKSTIIEDLHCSFWARGKQSGERFVAKVYDLKAGSGQGEIIEEEIKKQMIWNEVQALRTISHPNIVKLHDLYEGSGEVLAITQYIGGSTLVKHIQSKGYLPESETIYLMTITLQTLQDLHKQKVIHRNLHPENILVNYTSNGTQLKIVNFSSSCTLDSNDQSSWHVDRNLLTRPEVPGYIAPELFLNKQQSTIESEIFSMGAIIYACLTGEPLFKGRDQQDVLNKNKEMIIDERAERWHSLSDNAKHLIEKMTDKDPKKRPSINSILAHPFFSASLSYKTSLECENYIPKVPKLSIDIKYTSESTESPYTNKNSNQFSDSPMTLGVHKQNTQITGDYSRLLSAQGSFEYLSVKPVTCYQKATSFEPLVLEATETEFKSEFETDSPPVDDGAQIVRRNIKNLTSPPFSNSPFSGHSALLDSIRARKAESFPEEELWNNTPSIHNFSDIKKFGY